VAEPSPADSATFNRTTLVVGIILVTLAGAVAAFAFAKLQHHVDLGQLVYAGSGGIYEHDLATGADRKLTSIPKDITVAEPSPDGRFVAYANSQGSLWMYDIKARRRYQVAEQGTIPEGWSPDSKLVARELVGAGDVVLIDPNAGRKGLINGGSITQSLPVWITSSRFAIGDLADPNASLLVDTQGSEQPVVKAAFGVPLAASPDGAQLLTQRDHVLREGKVTPSGVTSGHVLFKGDAIIAATSPQGFVAFSAKGPAGKEGLWVLETGTEVKRLVTGQVDWLVFTPDGSAICYAKGGSIYALTLADHRTKRISRRGVSVLTLLSFRVVPS
jgi:WD40 repeat protein